MTETKTTSILFSITVTTTITQDMLLLVFNYDVSLAVRHPTTFSYVCFG